MMPTISTESEIKNIRVNEYTEAIKQAMTNAADVLKQIILEYLHDDFPVLWAEQYRKPEKAFPTAERSFLLYADKTGRIVNAVNQFFASAGDPARVSGHLSAANLDQERGALLRVPNDVFVPAVKEWLEGLSQPELEKTAAALVNSLDISGSANCIRFTSTPNTRDFVLLKRIERASKGAIQSSYIYSEKLGDFVGNRNKYLGHISESTLSVLTDATVFDVFENIQKLIQPFATSESVEIQNAVRVTQQYIQDEGQKIRMPVIILADMEKSYRIPEGTLGKALYQFTSLREYMDSECRVILFIPETEIKQYYSAYCNNFEIAKEMCAAPNNDELEEERSLPVSELKKYKSGKMTPSQLLELVQGFAIFADIGTLLSNQAMKAVASQLGRVLKTAKKHLLIEWGTLSYLYRLEKESTDAEEQERAKRARLQLYHMQKIGLVQYVGSTDHSIYPDKSLLDFIENHADTPICVITPNRVLAERLSSESTPYCISMTNWRDEGFLVRTVAKNHFNALCGIGEQKETGETHDLRDNACQPFHLAGDERKEPRYQEPEKKPLVKPAQTYFPVPKTGDTVLDETNAPIQLLGEVGSHGGEGTVYRTSRNGFVAKIYHAGKADSERFRKLRTMRGIAVNWECICWPKSLLYTKDKRFVGFLMVEAPSDSIEMGVSIFKLSGERIQKNVLPGWDRLSLAKVCASVSATFAHLHEKQILMADVNPRNFLISPSNPDKVYFVDCDSYQFGDFVCPVGMAEYSSPEILKRMDTIGGGYSKCPRTLEDEQFALASLLFHILMLGQTPFAAKGNDKIEEAIRNYSFAYRTKTNRGTDVPDGPYAMIWNNTPPYITEKFASVFTGGEKVSATSWYSEFRKYVSRIAAGNSTSELLPKKYYDAQGDFFQSFTCVGCHQEANMPKEKYDRLVQYRQPVFCNQCMSLLWPLKETETDVVCDSCHRYFKSDGYEKALQEYGKRVVCPTCRERTRMNRNRYRTF